MTLYYEGYPVAEIGTIRRLHDEIDTLREENAAFRKALSKIRNYKADTSEERRWAAPKMATIANDALLAHPGICGGDE
jgi:hypothetical protein